MVLYPSSILLLMIFKQARKASREYWANWSSLSPLSFLILSFYSWCCRSNFFGGLFSFPFFPECSSEVIKFEWEGSSAPCILSSFSSKLTMYSAYSRTSSCYAISEILSRFYLSIFFASCCFDFSNVMSLNNLKVLDSSLNFLKSLITKHLLVYSDILNKGS